MSTPLTPNLLNFVVEVVAVGAEDGGSERVPCDRWDAWGPSGFVPPGPRRKRLHPSRDESSNVLPTTSPSEQP